MTIVVKNGLGSDGLGVLSIVRTPFAFELRDLFSLIRKRRGDLSIVVILLVIILLTLVLYQTLRIIRYQLY
jgi:hypothetical protein